MDNKQHLEENNLKRKRIEEVDQEDEEEPERKKIKKTHEECLYCHENCQIEEMYECEVCEDKIICETCSKGNIILNQCDRCFIVLCTGCVLFHDGHEYCVKCYYKL